MDSAKEKLERAVERLENAVGVAAENAGKISDIQSVEEDRARLDTELNLLKADHEELGKKYATIEGDNSALEDAVSRVSDRLDATIDRLRAVLSS